MPTDSAYTFCIERRNSDYFFA